MTNVDRSQENPQEEKFDLKQKIFQLIPEAGGSVGGALIGLAVGGPIGAVAGAAISPAAATLFKIVHESLRRRSQRAQEVLAGAAELSGKSMADLEEQLTQSDDQLAFAIAVLTAAADTPLSEKRAAFTRLLAGGSQADHEKLVNEYMMIARALAGMDEPHIKVLSSISSKIEDQDDPHTGLTPGELAREFGQAPEALRPLVRLLEFYGLITDVAHRTSKSRSSVHWQITPLGLLCLKLLKSQEGEVT